MSADFAASRQAMMGRVFGKEIVAIERAPVSNFATAVRERHDVFFDPRSAQAAGFADIPVPPTYPFAMFHWGNFADVRAAHGIDPVPPNPLGDIMDQLGHIGLVIAEFIKRMGPGVTLHAEQSFEYLRHVTVGDVLIGKTRVADLYQRQSSRGTLTFIVVESAWDDAETGGRAITCQFTGVHSPPK
jgi:N-terminal half of MaoC dehydratase